MSREIGPREKALREMREATATRVEQERRQALPALREKVAAVPARKPKDAKKKPNRGRRT